MKLYLIKNPILKFKLQQLKILTTSTLDFRRIFHETSMLLAYEAVRNLSNSSELNIFSSKNSLDSMPFKESPIIIAIMRAGCEMIDGVLKILETSTIGHIGIYRDRETQNTIEYYLKLPPDIKQKTVFLLDPILGTGDTILACIERLYQFEVSNIIVLNLLVSKIGVEKIHYFYPEINIFAIDQEEILNESGFLMPGLGDISNRLYGLPFKKN